MRDIPEPLLGILGLGVVVFIGYWLWQHATGGSDDGDDYVYYEYEEWWWEDD